MTLFPPLLPLDKSCNILQATRGLCNITGGGMLLAFAKTTDDSLVLDEFDSYGAAFAHNKVFWI